MAIANTYARRTDGLNPRGGNTHCGSQPHTRFHFFAALLIVCLGLIFEAGCHKGSITSITINLDPNTTQQMDSGQMEEFTATLAGDSTNKGVRWTLTLNSNLCSTGTGAGCGALLSPTNTSVTYQAPQVSAQTSFQLTATSIADPVITSSVTVTVNIAPQITTTSIPSSGMNGVPYTATVQSQYGVNPLTYYISSANSNAPCGTGGNLPCGLTLNPNSGQIVGTPTFTGPGTSLKSTFTVQVQDFNKVQGTNPLTLSITVAAPTPIQGSATLPQAFVGAPYSGTISSSGGVPPLTYSLTSGSLPPNLSLNSNSGQITGTPTTASATPYSFGVTITDSALPTHQTALVSAAITVSTPSQLQINTNSLPNGTVGIGYGALLQASGGVPPYTWTLISGQLPSGLVLQSQSDNTALISGNPILVGSSTFNVEVTDATGKSAEPASPFSITISSQTGVNTNSLLSGSYTFLFQGYDASGPVAIAGTLTADGNGNVTSGFEDSNRAAGNVQNSSLSGSYTLGSDGRGTLHLVATPSIQASLETDYQLVLQSDGTLHMIENDDTNTNTDTYQTHGSGVLKLVSQGTFAVGSFSGNYAFEVTGQDYNAKPIALGGILHADGNSLLTPITADINDAGSFAALESPSGTFSYTASTLRGSITMLYSLAGKAQTQLQFAFYFVSSSDVFFVETDVPSVTDQFPRLSGEAILQQTGSTFGASSFSGESVITGTGLSGTTASVMAGLLTVPSNANTPGCNGSQADASLTYDQNSGGTVSFVTDAAASCVVGSNGRATFSTLDPRIAVAYLTGPGQGFILGSDAAVTTGLLELQTGSNFATQSVDGSYELNAASAGDPTVSSIVGQVASPQANGNLVGTLDEVDSPGTPAHLDQGLTLSINSVAADGSGTLGSNLYPLFPQQLAFYMVSPSEIRMIPLDSNPGKLHPAVIFLNH
jgi:Putative Ig domain